MAYEVVMSYHLHMPSYFLGTFTEYPYCRYKNKRTEKYAAKSYTLQPTLFSCPYV